MKLDKWDWAWLIFDVFVIILCSYFGLKLRAVEDKGSLCTIETIEI